MAGEVNECMLRRIDRLTDEQADVFTERRLVGWNMDPSKDGQVVRWMNENMVI